MSSFLRRSSSTVNTLQVFCFDFLLILLNKLHYLNLVAIFVIHFRALLGAGSA